MKRNNQSLRTVAYGRAPIVWRFIARASTSDPRLPPRLPAVLRWLYLASKMPRMIRSNDARHREPKVRCAMPKRFLSAMGLGLMGWACCGCAHTKITSFVDPDFRDRTYKRILVSVAYDDLEQRQKAETRFVQEFEDTKAECIPSMQILLPTRRYSDSEMFGLLEENGIDAILLVAQTDYYEDLQYIPESSTTTLSANTYYYASYARTYGSAHTTTTGGYYVRKPRWRHELTLYDSDTKRIAWIGTSLTRGNAPARFKHLVRALAHEAVEALIEDGLVVAALKEESPSDWRAGP
jgi:hypothetical protein